MEKKSSPQFFPPVVPRSLCPPENLWRIQFQMAPKRKAKTHHNTVFVSPVACHTTHLPTPLKIINLLTVKNNYRKKKSANSYRREEKKKSTEYKHSYSKHSPNRVPKNISSQISPTFYKLSRPFFFFLL